MQMQELQWDAATISQYGVNLGIKKYAALNIPLYKTRVVSGRPGGVAIKQLPEYILDQYKNILDEQEQEKQHFSKEEQIVFGSNEVPHLRVERLSSDTFHRLADIIHGIGKNYTEWTIEDYLSFTDALISLEVDGSHCEVHRKPTDATMLKVCLIYDYNNVIQTVGILDVQNTMFTMGPDEFFCLAQSIDGIPLHNEKVLVAYLLKKTFA